MYVSERRKKLDPKENYSCCFRGSICTNAVACTNAVVVRYVKAFVIMRDFIFLLTGAEQLHSHID